MVATLVGSLDFILFLVLNRNPGVPANAAVPFAGVPVTCTVNFR